MPNPLHRIRKKIKNFIYPLIPVSTATRVKLIKMAIEYPKLLPFGEVVRRVREEGISITRFGDGELSLAMGGKRHGQFQTAQGDLGQRLVAILKRPYDRKLLVCIPAFYTDLNNTKNRRGSLSFWESYWLRKYKQIKPYFTLPEYGCTDLSRLDVFHALPLAEIISMWAGRDMVFVVPQNGRFEYDERLFGNIKSKAEVAVPPMNAYGEYNRILKDCLKHSKDKLFFIAAGATATVLAADLHDRGYQALDMGHFPNSFHQFLGERGKPESSPFVKAK
ncbi:MAG: GT-D fold domain-containing glycosyltransferase [Alphaproteobacteria bacterium]|nr:GT-D fold domain-containing glycosyltransferase [Alphaproteobacteria bacterium]